MDDFRSVEDYELFVYSVRERYSVVTGSTLRLERRGAKRGWYDSQPHPNNPDLQPTHPHHKHVPPDLKRTRVPAPGLSFRAPNIPLLIAEVAALVQADDA